MIQKARAQLLFVIFGSILALDILSKWLAHTFLPLMQRSILPYPYGGVGVFENVFGISFSLNHQTNTGAAWGLFPESQKLIFYIRLSIIIVLSIYLLLFNKNLRSQIPFALIISGAFGNVIDTFFYGHVVDFLFFQLWGYDFPVFNLADSFIFIGVVWLCILNLREDGSKETSSSYSNESKPFDSTPFGK